ncbi:MAG: DUF4386 domain-containing protein [Lewinella sp.]
MEMDEKRVVTSLRLLYALWVMVGIFGLVYVPGNLIVHDDPTLTANNITGSEWLFRAGILARLVVQLIFILNVLLLYRLLAHVNRGQAVLMVAFALVSVPMAMYSETFQLLAADSLHRPDVLIAYLDRYAAGMSIAIIFWGLWLFPLGYLVYRSALFPNWVGLFLYVGGCGYLLGSLLTFLDIEAPGLKTIGEVLSIGETVFVAWLIFAGVSRSGKIRATSRS